MDNNAISPDTTIDDLLSAYPQLAEVMVERGMVCVGCPISTFHTVADVAALYELDKAKFLGELQQRLAIQPDNGSAKD